jgi:hypothetical protein
MRALLLREGYGGQVRGQARGFRRQRRDFSNGAYYKYAAPMGLSIGLVAQAIVKMLCQRTQRDLTRSATVNVTSMGILPEVWLKS